MSDTPRDPLRFACIARIIVERQYPNFSSAADRCGLTTERLTKLLRGDHEPLAADAFRLAHGLGLSFQPSDFEERGLKL